MTISTDPFRWIGFTNDPSESDGFCAWIHLGNTPSVFLVDWAVLYSYKMNELKTLLGRFKDVP